MPQRWSRWMRWNEIMRGACILGVVEVEDVEKGSCLKIAKILKKRVQEGRVEKRKNGAAQSSRADYRVRIRIRS